MRDTGLTCMYIILCSSLRCLSVGGMDILCAEGCTILFPNQGTFDMRKCLTYVCVEVLSVTIVILSEAVICTYHALYIHTPSHTYTCIIIIYT